MDNSISYGTEKNMLKMRLTKNSNTLSLIDKIILKIHYLFYGTECIRVKCIKIK